MGMSTSTPISGGLLRGSNARDKQTSRKGGGRSSINKQKEKDFDHALLYAPIGVPLGFADTTLQSIDATADLLIGAPTRFVTGSDFAVDFLQDDTLANMVPDAFGGDIYRRNQKAYRTTADIASLFVIPLWGAKAVRVGGALDKGLKTIGASEAIAARMLSNPSLVDKGVERLMALEKTGFLDGALTAGKSPASKAARKEVRKASFSNNLKEGIAGDLALYATMNQSELWFPEGVTKRDVAFSATLIPGFALVGGHLRTGWALRKGVQEATTDAAVQAARERRGLGFGVDSAEGFRDMAIQSNALTFKNLSDDILNITDPVMRSNMEGQINVIDARLGKELTTLTTDRFLRTEAFGDVGKVSGMGFRMSEAELAVAKRATINEPGLMEGAWSLSDLKSAQNFANDQNGLVKRLGEELEEAVTKGHDVAKIERLRLKLNRAGRSTVHVIEPDGTVINTLDRQKTIFEVPVFEQVNKGGTNTTRSGGFAVQPLHMIKGKQAGDSSFFMYADGRIIRPAKGNPTKGLANSGLHTSSVYELSAYYRMAGDSVIKDMVKSVKNIKGYSFNIGPSSNHIQLDTILKAARENPEVDILKATGKFNSLEELELEAITMKFEHFSDRLAKEAAGKLQAGSMHDMGKRLNLELTNGDGQLSMLGKFMLNFNDTSPADFRTLYKNMASFKSSLDEFALTELGNPARGASVVNAQFARSTSMLDYPIDVRPMGLLRDPLEQTLRSIDTKQLAVLANMRQGERIKKLAEISKKSPIVGRVTEAMLANKTLVDEARKVSEMQGAALSKSFMKITTNIFDSRDVVALREAHMVNRMVSQAVQDTFNEMVTPFKKAFDELKLPKNRVDLAEFEIFKQSRAMGWDFASDAVGKTYLLNSSERNKALWKKFFGDGVPMPKEGELFLPDLRHALKGKYVPLHTDTKAQSAINGLKSINEKLFQEEKLLRRAVGGVSLTPRRFMHLPAETLRDKEMAFVVDSATGEPLFTAVGRDAEEARVAAEKLLKENANGRMLAVVDRQADEWSNFADIAYNTGLADYSARLTGTKGSGAIGIGSTVRIDQTGAGLDSMLGQLHNRVRVLANSTTRVHFANELAQAKLFHQLDNKQLRKGLDGQQAEASIYEQYSNALFGRPNTHVGSALTGINKVLDQGYRRFTTGLQKAHDEVLPFVRAKGSLHNPANLSKLGRQLADRHGFAPLEAGLEAVKLPRSLRKDLSALNGLTSLLSLRLLNMSHAILNVASTPSTGLAQARHVQKRAGESFDAWKSRVGPYASIFEGAEVAHVSILKASAQAGEFMFSAEGKEVLQLAAKRGYLLAPVSEAAAATNRMGGRKRDKLYNKLIGKTGWLTSMNDSSEELSRKLSFAVGYKMFQQSVPSAKREQLMLAANRFADDAIGDYRGNIKGELFQHSSGIPLGLFQTYMTNLYQRIGRDLELGDKTAVFVRSAMQASLFGAESVAGYDMYTAAFGESYDGTANVFKSMHEAYGQDGADLMLEGTLSNIPKLFGADTGLAFYTRGNTNVSRLPFDVSKPLDRVPYGHILKKARYAYDEGVLGLINGGMSRERVQEVLAYSAPHRGLSGALEVFNGYSTNKSGDLINRDTRTAVDIAARMLSMKTTTESQLASQMWKQKQGTRKRDARVNALRRDLVAIVRADKLTKERVAEAHEQYIRFGRNPKYFDRWLKSIVIKANSTKAERKYGKLLRGGRVAEANRILYADPTIDD